MDADRLVDSIPDLVTDLHALWGKPATDNLVLKVSIKPFGKALVLARVTDKAGIILEGFAGQRRHLLDKVFGDTITVHS